MIETVRHKSVTQVGPRVTPDTPVTILLESGIFNLYSTDGTLLATSIDARALGEHAFSQGAKRVHHQYDGSGRGSSTHPFRIRQEGEF